MEKADQAAEWRGIIDEMSRHDFLNHYALRAGGGFRHEIRSSTEDLEVGVHWFPTLSVWMHL